MTSGMDANVAHKSTLGKNEIRILILEPLDEDFDSAFIQCRLVSTFIEGSVEYEALSYTWGEDARSPTCCIDCNEAVVSVSRNLYEALLALRLPDRSRTLWVDALCIDQASNDERNHQVSLMARIYRKATRVIIWLGKEGPAKDAERSFQHLKRLHNLVNIESKQVHRQSSLLSHVSESYLHATAPEQERTFLAKTALVLSSHPLVGLALNAFLSRPWFRRRWVLQEVYNSREAVLHCSDAQMPWEEFVVGILRLFSADHRYRVPLPIFNVPHGHRNLILDHLDLFDEYECHDDRDRIFSLLSLDERNSFLPDCNLTTPELFIKFAQYSVTDGGGLQILAQASWQSLEARAQSGLQTPSWVPDWRQSVRDPRAVDNDALRFSTRWKEELILDETEYVKPSPVCVTC